MLINKKDFNKDTLNLLEWERLYYEVAISKYTKTEERIKALGVGRRTYYRRLQEFGLMSKEG